MPEQPQTPRGARTLEQVHLRAGNPTHRYAPIISKVKPAGRPGWLLVHVSLAPGNNVQVQVREDKYSPEAVDLILQTTPSLYAPRGLRADTFASE